MVSHAFLNLWLWWQFIKNTASNITKAKINYCLGFTACFLVVFVVAVLVTVLSKSPLVFLRLSELQYGEMDATVAPGDWIGYEFINYTALSQDVLEPEFPYHSPRRIDPAQMYYARECPDKNISDLKWKYFPLFEQDYCGFSALLPTCFNKHCPAVPHTIELLSIKSSQEKKILLGREWDLPELKQGEVYLHAALVPSGISVINATVYIEISTEEFFPHPLWFDLTGVKPELDPLIYIPFTVAGVYQAPLGKHPIGNTNIVIVEYDKFIPHLASQLAPNTLSADAIANISQMNLDHYARTVIINLPPPRIDVYLNSNYDVLQKNVIGGWANKLFYKIGFTRIYTDLPVLGGLAGTKLIALFLGLILNVIIFILLFLSVLLIYSLLMINVENRVFELGVMRMVGTPREGIIMLLLVQAFSYSIPATIFGLIAAEGGTYGVVLVLKEVIGVPLPPNLTYEGAGWAILLGLLVPILASLLPIRSALGRNLHDSLDTRSSKTKAVKVKLSRSDPREPFSLPIILVGFCLALFGGVIYYMFPLALLSLNLGLLLNTFFFLLIGMLLGLTMLALNLQRIFEVGVLYAFFFWENKAIIAIVSKNLIAHRVRNRKTTIMYAISLGFIIFVSVAYSLQIQTFSYNQQQSKGALLRVSATNVISQTTQSGKPGSLNSNPKLVAALEKISATHPNVDSHAWISLRLGTALVNSTFTSVSHIGDLFSQSNSQYGISPSFFDATLSGFLITSENSYSRGLEPSELSKFLYTPNGTHTLLVSRLYSDSISLNVGTDLLVDIGFASTLDETTTVVSTYEQSFRLETGALLDSSPAFVISPFPAIFRQESIMGFISYFHFLTNIPGQDPTVFESIEEIPLNIFLVKLVDESKVDSVVAALRDALSNFDNDGYATIWDYRNEMGPFNTASTVMSYFFNFTTAIAMTISFFSLMSSMFTNVYEQTKEIAVLRALGVQKFSMYRVYIYEAFVLVFSSSLLGILIGTVVSYTMTLQQILFTQLPIPFQFPWTILLVVFGCSILFAVLAAFSPIYKLLRKRVVQIFRVVT